MTAGWFKPQRDSQKYYQIKEASQPIITVVQQPSTIINGDTVATSKLDTVAYLIPANMFKP